MCSFSTTPVTWAVTLTLHALFVCILGVHALLSM